MITIHTAVNGPLLPDAKPVLKWAGGKTQLLPHLLRLAPGTFKRYIEPFFGGGALFFALRPEVAIIADSNPELINLYRALADDVEGVLQNLSGLTYSEESFYRLRALDSTALSPAEAAARTIFLNRTCFNGLYRVNKSGRFNVPFGHYKNPRIVDEPGVLAASRSLQQALIVQGDYKDVLRHHAAAGDFVFLDPPYLPTSRFADFKRYTKEQFHEEDHGELREEVMRLRELGCHVLLTNSNHPVVHQQYAGFPIEVISTKRNISCKGSNRTSEDLIISVAPASKIRMRIAPPDLPEQALRYPSTRFMGSKNKLLQDIFGVASQFSFDTVYDLFSGSGIVGYLFKALGKQVMSNDYMAMSAVFSKALIENSNTVVTTRETQALLTPHPASDNFVANNFKELYYSPDDNKLIDHIRANIKGMGNTYKKAIATAALIRACLKKRPRGIFTYVGFKYNDGRKDLKLSFADQFIDAVEQINRAVFDNGLIHLSRHGDAMEVHPRPGRSLAYIDPPYYSPLSDNEYVRRYHFVEGIARDWQGVELQQHTLTKKFKSYPTPFSSQKGAHDAFHQLFKRFQDSIIIVSYSSNGLPTLDEMISLLAKYKTHVEVIPVDYKYSFGNQGSRVADNRNTVKEYLFIGY